MWSLARFLGEIESKIAEGSEVASDEVLSFAQELVQRIHPNFFANHKFMESYDIAQDFDVWNRAAMKRELSIEALPLCPNQVLLLPLARQLAEQLTVGTDCQADSKASMFAQARRTCCELRTAFAQLAETDRMHPSQRMSNDQNKSELATEEGKMIHEIKHWPGDPFCRARRSGVVIKCIFLFGRSWAIILYSWSEYEPIHYQDQVMLIAGALTVLCWMSMVWLYFSRRSGAWDRSMWEHWSNLQLPKNNYQAHAIDPLVLDGA